MNTVNLLKRTIIISTIILILLFANGLFAQKVFANSEIIDSGTDKNLNWTLDENGVLNITGTGRMNNYYVHYGGEYPPWHSQSSNIIHVIINDGITNIGVEAFEDCINLKDITVPESVTSIEEHAFAGCINLVDINLPDNFNNTLNCSLFLNAKTRNLTEITIPEGINTIQERAFENYVNLEKITIPDSVEEIDDNAFRGCTNLNNVIIPNKVKSIGPNAFQNCSSLSNILIGENINHIAHGTFYNCSNLKSIVLPNGMKSIEESAFYGCSELESLEIYNSKLSWLSEDAFDGCNKLTIYTDCDNLLAQLIKKKNIEGVLKHKWEEDYAVDKQATCTEEGSKSIHCINCGLIEATTVTTIPVLGHVKEKISAVSATCTKDGLTEGEICSRCGKVFVEQKTIAATGHFYNSGKVIKKADIKRAGKIKYTCKNDSSHKYYKEIPPLELKIKAKKSTFTVKFSKIKNKAQTINKPISIKGAKTKITYTKISGKSAIKVNPKNGKITIKKGTKKGNYKIKIKVKTASSKKYKSTTTTITLKIKVK